MAFLQYIQTSIPDYENNDIEFWSKNSTIKTISLKKITKRINEIKVIKSKDKKHKILTEFLSEVIADLIENSKYNLRIDNIPNLDTIDEEILQNTFSPWGSVHMMKKYKDSLYIWYHYDSDARLAHSQLDQMMIDNNIITTIFQESKRLVMKYNWQTKKRYDVYNFMGQEIMV